MKRITLAGINITLNFYRPTVATLAVRSFVAANNYQHANHGNHKFCWKEIAMLAASSATMLGVFNSMKAECSDDQRPLTRNFVAEAAAIAAPSVVNISSTSGGGLFMTGSAGSGFIITEVFHSYIIELRIF